MKPQHISNITRGLLHLPSLDNKICRLAEAICVKLSNRNGYGPIWHLLLYIRWTCLCYVCTDDCSMLAKIDKLILLSMERAYVHDCCWMFHHDMSMREVTYESAQHFNTEQNAKGWYLMLHINQIIFVNE